MSRVIPSDAEMVTEYRTAARNAEAAKLALTNDVNGATRAKIQGAAEYWDERARLAYAMLPFGVIVKLQVEDNKR
jgi:hypothetical protein